MSSRDSTGCRLSMAFFLAQTALSEAREFALKILGTLEEALGTDFPERHLD